MHWILVSVDLKRWFVSFDTQCSLQGWDRKYLKKEEDNLARERGVGVGGGLWGFLVSKTAVLMHSRVKFSIPPPPPRKFHAWVYCCFWLMGSRRILQGFKQPLFAPVFFFFFFFFFWGGGVFLLAACLSERLVMYKDTPTPCLGNWPPPPPPPPPSDFSRAGAPSQPGINWKKILHTPLVGSCPLIA